MSEKRGEAAPMTDPDTLAVARKVHEALELLNGRKLAIGGVAIVADALTEARNEGIGEAAKAIPTTWLDPLLTGPDRVIRDSPCPEIERLLHLVGDRIRSLKRTP